MMIEIEGDIILPGVYELPRDSRIKDIVCKDLKAFRDADRNWSPKNINFAAKFADGKKLYLPFKSESLIFGSIRNRSYLC